MPQKIERNNALSKYTAE